MNGEGYSSQIGSEIYPALTRARVRLARWSSAAIAIDEKGER